MPAISMKQSNFTTHGTPMKVDWRDIPDGSHIRMTLEAVKMGTFLCGIYINVDGMKESISYIITRFRFP